MTTVENLEKIISEPLDPRLISEREGGAGIKLSYISGTSMYMLLKKAFGPFFSIEYSEPKIVKYDTVSGSRGNSEAKQAVEIKCRLTVPIYDPVTNKEHTVIREGYGTALRKSRGDEENVVKAAQTDALKRAAMTFGFGVELYFKPGSSEFEYWNEQLFGIWTKEAATKYSNELNIVKEYLTKNKLNDINAFAVFVTGDSNSKVTPVNIVSLIEQYNNKKK